MADLGAVGVEIGSDHFSDIGAGVYHYAGDVLAGAAPQQKELLLVDPSTLNVIGRLYSDATTGAFNFQDRAAGPMVVIQRDATLQNDAQVYDYVNGVAQ